MPGVNYLIYGCSSARTTPGISLYWSLKLEENIGGQADSPKSPEIPEITEMTEKFPKVTEYLTKLGDIFINYV